MSVRATATLELRLRTPDLLLLEITGKCQLACVHCYADSGPRGTHGTMTYADWERVIEEAADLGVPRVQFTGGEPTMHPGLPHLIRWALSCRLEVEVYTNLVHVTPQMWEVFGLPGVRIGTSYYSDVPSQHQAVTGTRGSHARTTRAIKTAVERGIPIRVGLIDIHRGQRVGEAGTMLASLGVHDIYVDSVRRLGRARARRQPDISQLCGTCAGDLLTVLPDGTVSPCPMSRWISVGNVRYERLRSILAGRELHESRTRIRKASDKGSVSRPPGFRRLSEKQCAPP